MDTLLSEIVPKQKNQSDFPLYTTGILPSQKIKRLIDERQIAAESDISESQIQPASIDLRLGRVAYRVMASFLPREDCPLLETINRLKMYEVDLSRPAILEKGCVYVIPLMEQLKLRDLSGRANPKSTIGRLDLFTRLICDRTNEFDFVPPSYTGPLYAQVVPRTFSVLAQQGIALNQLRFIRGTPPSLNRDLIALHFQEPLVYVQDRPIASEISKGLWVSIDLVGEGKWVGYKARHHTPLIDLTQINHYDPLDFWEPISPPTQGRLILNTDDFYILVSKERVRVPHHYAAQMVAYEPSIGEFRVHYAGFFDPGFGYGNGEVKGTPAVLEVRSHEAPFLLEDGQRIGRLVYERLLSPSDKIYGKAIGSSYAHQTLSLSKQFRRE